MYVHVCGWVCALSLVVNVDYFYVFPRVGIFVRTVNKSVLLYGGSRGAGVRLVGVQLTFGVRLPAVGT